MVDQVGLRTLHEICSLVSAKVFRLTYLHGSAGDRCSGFVKVGVVGRFAHADATLALADPQVNSAGRHPHDVADVGRTPGHVGVVERADRTTGVRGVQKGHCRMVVQVPTTLLFGRHQSADVVADV